MNHNDIQLSNMSKSFEFEQQSRKIDSMTDIKQVKDVAKYMIKLYLKQQETVAEIAKGTP